MHAFTERSSTKTGKHYPYSSVELPLLGLWLSRIGFRGTITWGDFLMRTPAPAKTTITSS